MVNTQPHLEVIAGTMFSGKTTELLRRLSVYRAVELKTQLFKPAVDTRSGLDKTATHSGLIESAEYVGASMDLIQLVPDETDVIGIEEAQFFHPRLAKICNELINRRGKIVVASGLLNDYQEKPFPAMQELIRYADHFDLLKALCKYREQQKAEICGAEATRVIYLGDLGEKDPATIDGPTVKIGGAELYSPRCRLHYIRD